MVYRIKAEKLVNLINEEVSRYLKENSQNEKVLGVSFGVQARKENRINTFRYARLYGTMVSQIQAIENQLLQRVQMIQNAQQTQISEGGLGAVVKGSTKAVRKLGLKNGMKLANRTYGKAVRKKLFGAAIASVIATLSGVPQRIGQWLEHFKNPAQAKPNEVIEGYGELAGWMQEICQTTQEYPEILGAATLQDSTLNGPEEVQGNGFSVKDGVELAASIGVSFIPIVGWAYDAVDIAGSLISAKAESEQEGLKVVEKQYQYIEKAIADMNNVLQQTSNPQTLQQAATQNTQQQTPQQQPQQQVAQQQLPQGYIVGQPAPFANTDPQQVMRLQQYLGLQATGRWDRNTQGAWDNWLRTTYHQA